MNKIKKIYFLRPCLASQMRLFFYFRFANAGGIAILSILYPDLSYDTKDQTLTPFSR